MSLTSYRTAPPRDTNLWLFARHVNSLFVHSTVTRWTTNILCGWGAANHHPAPEQSQSCEGPLDLAYQIRPLHDQTKEKLCDKKVNADCRTTHCLHIIFKAFKSHTRHYCLDGLLSTCATRGDRTHILGFSVRRMNHHCQSCMLFVGVVNDPNAACWNCHWAP